MSDENGHQNGQTRVKFADGITKDIPIEWASIMLRDWYEKHPLQFGKALAEAASKAP